MLQQLPIKLNPAPTARHKQPGPSGDGVQRISWKRLASMKSVFFHPADILLPCRFSDNFSRKAGYMCVRAREWVIRVVRD